MFDTSLQLWWRKSVNKTIIGDSLGGYNVKPYLGHIVSELLVIVLI